MENEKVVMDIGEDIENPSELDEMIIEDVYDEEPSTEPPAGFEDLLYETWRDNQPSKNDKPDPDKNAVSA